MWSWGSGRRSPPRPYEKDIAKYVMVPGNAQAPPPHCGGADPETHRLCRDHGSKPGGAGRGYLLGIITSSTCYQYAREVFGPQASILKLGLVNPCPGRGFWILPPR